MKILAETHTHTCASTHAYHTMGEMIAETKRKGIELIAFTDHGPALPDAPHAWHFGNLKAVPRKVDGIYVLRGAETNIMDMEGTIDLPEETLRDLDVVIASVHDPLLEPSTVKNHTNMYLNVLNNPYVDILGHSGSPNFAYDIDKVLAEAKKLDKIIEINSHTFSVRKKNIANCKKIARRCAELGVKIVISSDAHSIFELGMLEPALQVVREAGVPEELVMNTDADKFLHYLCERKGLNRSIFESTIPGNN